MNCGVKIEGEKFEATHRSSALIVRFFHSFIL